MPKICRIKTFGRIALAGILSLAALPAASHGQATAPRSAPRRPTGAGGSSLAGGPIVDITDFGGRGDNGKTDNAIAYEAAYAELLRRLSVPGAVFGQTHGVIRFPASTLPYVTTRPLRIEHANIRVMGDPIQQPQVTNRGKGPVFVLGIRTGELIKDQKPLRLDASYRPDVFGKLDESVAKAPGQRFGIRTKKDSSVIFQAVPFSHGGPEPEMGNTVLDNWGSTRTLTVECAVESPDGGVFPGGYVGGIFAIGYLAFGGSLVFSLEKGGTPNQFDVHFRTAEDGRDEFNGFSFFSGKARGVQRLTFQLDLEHRKVSAFSNGVETAIDRPYGKFFKGTGPTTLARNEYSPLILGATSMTADLRAPVGALGRTTDLDLRLHGLSFSRRLRYESRRPGIPQARVDGKPIDDRYRYLEDQKDDPDLISALALTDSPDDPTTGRFVTSVSRLVPPYKHVGYFLQTAMYSQLGGILGNGLSDLHIVSMPGCPTVQVGAILNLKIERCRIEGGTQAIGTLNLLANYMTDIIDCELSGSDCGVYGAWSALNGRNVKFLNAGRVPIRTWASNATFDGVSVFHASLQSESLVKIHGGLYGGMHSYKNVLSDFEGLTYRVAPFVIEQFNGLPAAPATMVRIEDVYLGTTGKVPMFKVTTRPEYRTDGRNYVHIMADNIQTHGTDYTMVLDADGPQVTGHVTGLAPPGGPKTVKSLKDGGKPVLLIRDVSESPEK